MSGYSLRNVGLPYHHIMHNRKTVGRVFLNSETKKWIGKVGPTIEGPPMPTPVLAFHEVVARALGFENAQELREHNARVARRNRAKRAEANDAVQKMLRGDFSMFDKMLGLSPKK